MQKGLSVNIANEKVGLKAKYDILKSEHTISKTTERVKLVIQKSNELV